MAIKMETVNRGKQLLVMTIEIGDGRQDFIAVYEKDDPSALAQEFSSKYNLDSTLTRNLSIMIKENKNEVLSKGLHLQETSESESFSQSPYVSPIKSNNHKSESRFDKISKDNSKLTPKGNVYGTVYKQLSKNGTSKSITTLNSQYKKSSNFNYGDYLYARGIKAKEHLSKFSEQKKQELYEKEISELTFSPLINNNSSYLSPRAFDKPENILLKKNEEKAERLQKLKQELEQEQYKECLFTPKINETSKSKESFGKIHEELYLQAERLKEKKNKKIEDELNQIPFKPDIKNAKKKNIFETKDQLFDRLESSKKNAEIELDKIRKAKEEAEVDEVTGQKLFRPLTSVHSDKNISRHNSEPIWEYLYSQKDSKEKEIFTSQQEYYKQLEKASVSKKITENSDRIYNEFRNRQFENMFRKMDFDYDGLISAKSININDIDLGVLKILTSFFEELEKSDESLSLADFLVRMDEIYRNCNVEQRALLIKRKEKKEEEPQERKPYVSINSCILAEKKRKSLPVDFFERQNAVSKMIEMQNQKKRDEKDDLTIKDCTFKPDLRAK